jgi:hypothetical protein
VEIAVGKQSHLANRALQRCGAALVLELKLFGIVIDKILPASDFSPESHNPPGCAVSSTKRYGATLFLIYVLPAEASAMAVETWSAQADVVQDSAEKGAAKLESTKHLTFLPYEEHQDRASQGRASLPAGENHSPQRSRTLVSAEFFCVISAVDFIPVRLHPGYFALAPKVNPSPVVSSTSLSFFPATGLLL